MFASLSLLKKKNWNVDSLITCKDIEGDNFAFVLLFDYLSFKFGSQIQGLTVLNLYILK